jgi:hypothetical protein
LFQHGRELTAIEIKSSSTYKAALLKGLNKIAALSPAIKSACLVYAGDDMIFTDGTQAVNFSNVNRIFSV